MRMRRRNHGVSRSFTEFLIRGLFPSVKLRVLRGFLVISFFAFLSCNNAPDKGPETWEDTRSLKDLYNNHFLMGNIISTGDLGNNARFGYLKRHYNSVTAENQMKPNDIAPYSQPTDDNWAYRFTNADRIVDAALAEGMSVVGHTLIWHSQTPAWLTTGDAATVEANLNKYVTDVVTHFKGRVISWDVVNEAMRDGLNANDAINWRLCLRTFSTGNGWHIIGSEYIEKAFLMARVADPDAKLYYNDYNLNSSSNKYLAVYNMVYDINSRYSDMLGRPLIDGIGMQSHHHLGTNPQTVNTSIKKFAELGVEIAISELDIIAATSLPNTAPPRPWSPLSDVDIAQKQAEQYAAMFRIFKDNAAVISRVTFWGIDDGTSWRGYVQPTLLNADYSLKPAFYAVLNPDRY